VAIKAGHRKTALSEAVAQQQSVLDKLKADRRKKAESARDAAQKVLGPVGAAGAAVDAARAAAEAAIAEVAGRPGLAASLRPLRLQIEAKTKEGEDAVAEALRLLAQADAKTIELWIDDSRDARQQELDNTAKTLADALLPVTAASRARFKAASEEERVLEAAANAQKAFDEVDKSYRDRFVGLAELVGSARP
jgi:hypothetical protein